MALLLKNSPTVVTFPLKPNASKMEDYRWCRTKVYRGVHGSYCQIWCMGKKLGGFPAELTLVYSVDELDAVDDVGELLEAA